MLVEKNTKIKTIIDHPEVEGAFDPILSDYLLAIFVDKKIVSEEEVMSFRVWQPEDSTAYLVFSIKALAQKLSEKNDAGPEQKLLGQVVLKALSGGLQQLEEMFADSQKEVH